MKSSGTNSPEGKISELIKRGKLMLTGAKAIEQSHKLGLSVTIVKEGKIIRLHADGSEEQIGIVSRRRKTKTYSGKMYIQ
jgi:hypothetical protein